MSPRLTGREGIETRHLKRCDSQSGAKCNCEPSYRGLVWDRRAKKPVRGSWVKSLADARGWRVDALAAIRAGRWRTPTKRTVAEAGSALVAGMADGSIRNRSGYQYKPSVVRSYEATLQRYVLPELGTMALQDVSRSDVQGLVDRLAMTLSGSTTRNAIMPLRVMFRHALARDLVSASPMAGLELPASQGQRERVAPPAEAAGILAALSGRERAIWATALYAGLRLGEIRAIRLDEIDTRIGVIEVNASWDAKEGRIATKSRAGRRTVPIIGLLADELARWAEYRSWSTGLVFGRSQERPFAISTAYSHARRQWNEAGCDPILLHECRHSYASYMIAAGVNAKALCKIMGHSSITETFDRYGHLFPGDEAQAGALLTDYLAR